MHAEWCIRCTGKEKRIEIGLTYIYGIGINKSKELLAILVDRRGAGMTAKQICSIMWSAVDDDSKHMTYVRQLFVDLRNALRYADAEKVLQQKT